MPSKNLTTQFRALVDEQKQRGSPSVDSKKQKHRARGDVDATKHNGETKDVFLAEAYTVLGHITNLDKLLKTVRRPYLNVETSPSFAQTSPRALDFTTTEDWGSLRHLTDEQREQIDLQAKIILTRCAERVRLMEEHEQTRMQATSKKSNAILSLLPTRLLNQPTSSTAASDLIAAHRSSITWYLTRRLTEVSQSQKEMQEERVQRQLEKARTLGSSVASYSLENGRGSWGANSTDTLPESSRDGSSFRKTPSSLPQLTQTDYEPSEEDEEDDLELSPSQILQFESENAAILQQVESVLHEVQQAESRLLDISALQTQLVVELARQTEVVDQLYDEAMITQGEVQKGNVQLKQAKERAKESRKWLLLFIIGATLAILFLDYYD